MSSLLLVLLPPQLAPKTFCSELEDKPCTVPSLRRVPMRLYIWHCFHFDSGIRVSHHGVCFIVFRALGKRWQKCWFPLEALHFADLYWSSLFSLTLRERQSTEDSPQDHSGRGDALVCLHTHGSRCHLGILKLSFLLSWGRFHTKHKKCWLLRLQVFFAWGVLNERKLNNVLIGISFFFLFFFKCKRPGIRDAA